MFIPYKSTDDDDVNLGKPVQQKVQPLKAPNSRNLPSKQRQIIIDDFSSSSSEDEQPINREEDEDVCAGVGTSMLYPYSGDDTILETPERAPKVRFLREVDGDEAPPLKKFSSKLKGKSFSLFKLGDPKLPYLISGLTSFQSPDIY